MRFSNFLNIFGTVVGIDKDEILTLWNSASDRFLLAWATSFIASISLPWYFNASFPLTICWTSSGLNNNNFVTWNCQNIYHIYYTDNGCNTQTSSIIYWLTCSALFLPWAYILAQSVHFYLQQNHTVRRLHKSMRMPSWSHVLLMHVIFQPIMNKIFKIMKNCKSTLILSKSRSFLLYD